MPYRQYDWSCKECAAVHPDLVWVPSGQDVPDQAELHCASCGIVGPHQRRISAPAFYMYDRPWAPQVFGGSFDTMGNKRPPPLPELPDGASLSDAKDFFNQTEYKEAKAERKHAQGLNKIKKQRAAAMRKDPNIDLRRAPLPGDPKGT